jgi:hypothetical protein
MEELQYRWRYDRQPYLLINTVDLKRLQLDSIKPLAKAEGWVLITKETHRL